MDRRVWDGYRALERVGFHWFPLVFYVGAASQTNIYIYFHVQTLLETIGVSIMMKIKANSKEAVQRYVSIVGSQVKQLQSRNEFEKAFNRAEKALWLVSRLPDSKEYVASKQNAESIRLGALVERNTRDNLSSKFGAA